MKLENTGPYLYIPCTQMFTGTTSGMCFHIYLILITKTNKSKGEENEKCWVKLNKIKW